MQDIQEAIRALAVAKAIKEKEQKEARGFLTAGTYMVDQTVRVKGQIKVGEDGEYTPTVHVPIKTTIALLLKRMGFQRDEAKNILMAVMTEAVLAERKAADIFKDEVEWMTRAEEEVAAAMAAELPKAPRKGTVTTKLDVEYLEPVAA